MSNSPNIIYGVVSDNSGLPIAGARIYFIDSPVALPDIAVLSDDNGQFSLSVPAAGNYQIGCAADGFSSSTATINVASGLEAHINIKLKK